MINQITVAENARGTVRREGPAQKANSQKDRIGFAAVLDEAGSRKAAAADRDEPEMETIAQAAGNMISSQNRPLRDDAHGESGQKTTDTAAVASQAAGAMETARAVEKNMSAQAAQLPALAAQSPAEPPVVPRGDAKTSAATLAAPQPETGQDAPFTAELAAVEWTVGPGLASSSDAAGVRKNTAGLENDPAEALSTVQAAENTPLPVKKEKADHGRHLGHFLQTEAGEAMTEPKALGRRLAGETQPVSPNGKTSRPVTEDLADLQPAPAENQVEQAPKGIKTPAGEIHVVQPVTPETAEIPAADSSPTVQVADRVLDAVKQQRFQLEMKLQPEGLGQLSLKMAYEGGRLTLHILADTPQAQTILSQQMGELKSILESQHVLVDRMQVSLEKQEQPLWSNGGFHHFQEQGRQKGQNLNHRRFQPAINTRVEAGAAYYQPSFSQGILNDRA